MLNNFIREWKQSHAPVYYYSLHMKSVRILMPYSQYSFKRTERIWIHLNVNANRKFTWSPLVPDHPPIINGLTILFNYAKGNCISQWFIFIIVACKEGLLGARRGLQLRGSVLPSSDVARQGLLSLKNKNVYIYIIVLQCVTEPWTEAMNQHFV